MFPQWVRRTCGPCDQRGNDGNVSGKILESGLFPKLQELFLERVFFFLAGTSKNPEV